MTFVRENVTNISVNPEAAESFKLFEFFEVPDIVCFIG